MPKKEMNTLVVGTNEYEIVDSTARSSISSKQDILVSGTNIKTINGSSILGSGDLVVNSANDGVLTIQKNGTTVTTFSANQSTDVIANITVPTDASDIDYQYGGSLTPVQQATNVQDALDDLDDFVNGLDSGKQDTLVSGTNIKTINGSSILGNGDLTVNSANDGILTLTENGVTVDTFTANQATNTTVDFGNLAFYNADTLASGVDTVLVGINTEVLWENVSVGSGMAVVDIPLTPSAKVKYYIIELKVYSSSTTNYRVNMIFSPENDGLILITTFRFDGSTNYQVGRTVRMTTENVITVGQGYYGTAWNNMGTASNHVLVPTKITAIY